ncbi:cell division protein FtsQ/DivIB [Aequorivita marisscotiae]|uniref:Cell division protein FtsQ/DivIB n=1 Tax=Aequorivita marisscotiae TaxID=3040348 RepID=A0ABY8KYD8_9FLAO|nr:cell division protein FtsQ/DivIB [Aequorivita sp. Ant34-E75]WGF92841.1 cell division protein FtsQ/DivIB [Aequorivita sp. Ant34-E75]
MKRSLDVIKFILLLVVLAFLFSFTKKRNDARKISKLEIQFVDENSPFITFNTVNKLLIQNHEKVTSIGKETLVLKEMEERLRKNPMVRDAQVYVSVNGALGAKIEQRRPIGRVSASPDYYLDADGEMMPLSTVYSARVPIISGTSKNNFNEVTALLLKIDEDEFMKQMVVGINRSADGSLDFELRKTELKLLFGQPENITQKFQNFKAFYKKTKQDSTLFGYKMVNLKFDNQVIATKK